jgi:small subunit ribosomal protein S1
MRNLLAGPEVRRPEVRPPHVINEAGWAQFVAQHEVGDVVVGQVVSIVPFGAFIRLGEEVDGLAPKPMRPSRPELGSQVAVRIAAIDQDGRRFSAHPA